MNTWSETSLFSPGVDFPYCISHFVKDVQHKNLSFCRLHSTIAEAIDWLGKSRCRTIPVLVHDGPGVPTIAAVQTINAKAIIRILLDRLVNHTFTPADFFATPLSEIPSRRAQIIYPDLDLVSAARRMYLGQTDVLFISEGIKLSGIVTTGDIFDAMIGSAVLDNALFSTDENGSANDLILETAKICCFKQPVAHVYDTTPLHQLSTDNAALTALRILLNHPAGNVLLTNRQSQCRHLLTVPVVLIELLNTFRGLSLGLPQDNFNAILMTPLEQLIDIPDSPTLSPGCTVLEALETIHFNDLSCAPVIADQQFEGVVTTASLLKAFLDSMERPFLSMQY